MRRQQELVEPTFVFLKKRVKEVTVRKAIHVKVYQCLDATVVRAPPITLNVVTSPSHKVWLQKLSNLPNVNRGLKCETESKLHSSISVTREMERHQQTML